MKIKITKRTMIEGKWYEAGQTAEVTGELGSRLCEAGCATPAKGQHEEHATASTDTETAAKGKHSK